MALEDLKAHLPYSRMAHSALDELARHLGETFFAQGDRVLAPEDGPPSHLIIVKRGRIRAALIGGSARTDTIELVAGESFPIRALLEHRAVGMEYRAVEDTFCYLLPQQVFQRLLETSAEFLEYCSERLQSMVRAAAQDTHARNSTDFASQVPLTTALRDIVRREPVVCLASTPLGEAFQTLVRERVGSVVVVDDARRPLGVFTLRDVLPRVVLPGLPLSQPISDVMSRPARGLTPDAPAWRAAVEMARFRMAHLCVLDGERLVGVVSERDLFPMQRARMVPLTHSISEAANLEELQRVNSGIGPLVEHLLAQGLSAEPLVEIITTLNDHTTRRVIELSLAADEQEHGKLPCTFTWLSFGSEGRGEQTLKTDQDNGMLLHLPGDEPPEPVRQRLLLLAKRINAGLERCGFPLCPGNIMAQNPLCCLTLDEWRARFGQWVDQGAPEHLLGASIFFDLRPLYGDAAPVGDLRDWLRQRVPTNPRFLQQMALNAMRHRPPLSWLDSIVVTHGGEHPHTVNLKAQAATPYVDAARVWALAGGQVETNTARRLRTAAQQQRLPEREVQGWVAAWEYLQTLRMQVHRQQMERAEPRSNHVDPHRLNALEQRLLREVLRQARAMQTRLAMDYGLSV